MKPQQIDHTRFFVAMALAAITLVVWEAKVEWPTRQLLARSVVQQNEQTKAAKEKEAQTFEQKSGDAESNPSLTREQRIATSPRITLHSDSVHGSIALKGARFDDLTLAKYRETLDKDSPDVTLLSPAGDEEAYFAQIGWVAADNATKVPDQNTLWQSDTATLAAGSTAHLHWDNGQGVIFGLDISLDNAYMFTIEQHVENHSGHAIQLMPYGYLNRTYVEPKQHYAILHEGPLGVLDGSLDELSYKDLRDKGNKEFVDASGWLGITDKYWQASLIPGEAHFKATFSHYTKNSADRYQADYLADAETIANGETSSAQARLFAGAKEINLLDAYAAGDESRHIAPIPLFDRSVDFGSLYFLTKPMFLLLNLFYLHIGNFGLAIMLLTIVVKTLMFPVATQAYKTTSQMRALQPEMAKIKERNPDDKLKQQQEIMALYKREQVHPASGCLPVLIQMPVFFALYKVFFVTIEMRHAPFFGWIKDLSVPDPSNIFNAFGLIPWTPPTFLHLGLLPILMCTTMVIQMKQQPKPTDPVQAQMMNIMPYFMLFVFSRFAAGLTVYWVWSNTLSIIQQRIISSRFKRRASGKATPAAA